jgi:hypothetical protein
MDFPATHAALDHFDAVDQPALDAMRRKQGGSLNLSVFNDARKRAADRVRAAYFKELGGNETEENVELMPVEKIRAAIERTFLGRMLGLLP